MNKANVVPQGVPSVRVILFERVYEKDVPAIKQKQVGRIICDAQGQITIIPSAKECHEMKVEEILSGDCIKDLSDLFLQQPDKIDHGTLRVFLDCDRQTAFAHEHIMSEKTAWNFNFGGGHHAWAALFVYYSAVLSASPEQQGDLVT